MNYECITAFKLHWQTLFPDIVKTGQRVVLWGGPLVKMSQLAGTWGTSRAQESTAAETNLMKLTSFLRRTGTAAAADLATFLSFYFLSSKFIIKDSHSLLKVIFCCTSATPLQQSHKLKTNLTLNWSFALLGISTLHEFGSLSPQSFLVLFCRLSNKGQCDAEGDFDLEASRVNHHPDTDYDDDQMLIRHNSDSRRSPRRWFLPSHQGEILQCSHHEVIEFMWVHDNLQIKSLFKARTQKDLMHNINNKLSFTVISL